MDILKIFTWLVLIPMAYCLLCGYFGLAHALIQVFADMPETINYVINVIDVDSVISAIKTAILSIK